jgi:hypothetical protein
MYIQTQSLSTVLFFIYEIEQLYHQNRTNILPEVIISVDSLKIEINQKLIRLKNS